MLVGGSVIVDAITVVARLGQGKALSRPLGILCRWGGLNLPKMVHRHSVRAATDVPLALFLVSLDKLLSCHFLLA